SYVTMAFDAAGNLTGWRDDRGFHERTYDLRRDLLEERIGGVGSPPVFAYTLTLTYDAARRRASLTDAAGGAQEYGYDALSRLRSLVNPSGERTTVSYDSRGRVNLIEQANGSDITHTYDATGGTKSIETHVRATPAQILAREDYTLDHAGRVTAVLHSSSSSGTSRTTYTFDGDYRLTREHRSDTAASPVDFDIVYGYDAANNRVAKTVDGATTTYSFDERNALLSAEEAGPDWTTYGYDGRGNRISMETSAGVVTYAFDYESRLVGMTDVAAAEDQSYRLTAFGQRLGWTDKDAVLVTEVWDRGSLLSQTRGGTRNRFTVTPSGLVLSQSEGPRFFSLNAFGTLDTLADASLTYHDSFAATRFGEIQKDVTVSGLIVVPKFLAGRGWVTDSVALTGPWNLITAGVAMFDPSTATGLGLRSVDWAVGPTTSNPEIEAAEPPCPQSDNPWKVVWSTPDWVPKRNCEDIKKLTEDAIRTGDTSAVAWFPEVATLLRLAHRRTRRGYPILDCIISVDCLDDCGGGHIAHAHVYPVSTWTRWGEFTERHCDICINKSQIEGLVGPFGGMDWTFALGIVAHEVAHCLQYCHRAWEPTGTSCRECLCREIQANSASGVCKLGVGADSGNIVTWEGDRRVFLSERQCSIHLASTSCRDHCSRENALELADDVFDECAHRSLEE
ncbi:MAG: RHS repeat protein, partial [Thermoleophilia bacterium]|nr:RHS repeat protein [Thermoleophilia bacterium]